MLMSQGSKQKMGCLNVHKGLGRSQLSKTDTGTLERNSSTRPECTRSIDLTRCDTACPTERCHKGENSKWATQTCTRDPGGHNLAKLIWALSNEMAQPDLNVPGRATSHGAPERTMPQGIKWKMGHPNVHKEPGWTQLSKTDTGALEQN